MLSSILKNLLRLLALPLRILPARRVPPGAYVIVEATGPLVELPRPRSLFSRVMRRGGRPPLALQTLRELSRAVAKDPRARGVIFKIDGLAAGPAALASMRDVLSEIRAGGKDVVAFLPSGADTRALYVASAARLVVVGPGTMVSPLGYAAVGRYLRRALDRLGVEPEVLSRGTYKSAGERLTRDSMSDAEREQLEAVLESHHEALLTALHRGRGVDRQVARGWVDEAPHPAERAVELGIVDAIAFDDELAARVVGEGQTLAEIPKGRYLRASRAGAFVPVLPRPSIGVVEIHGPIVSSPRLSVGRVAAEEQVVSAIRAARADRSMRGVVLHVNSPGGSAVASSRIHHEVVRLAEEKPVVAYLADVAASGGYYVAAAAHAVVAQPQTVTGSIGVVAARLVVGPLLERLGVGTSVVKRGARADLFSTARRLDDGERASLERELDAFYRTFLDAVARGRGRTVEEIEPHAGGRVYSGSDAQARGLVDRLGGFDRALHEVRELLGASAGDVDVQLVRPRRRVAPAVGVAPEIARALAELCGALGLADLADMLELGLDIQGARTLAYWPGAIA